METKDVEFVPPVQAVNKNKRRRFVSFLLVLGDDIPYADAVKLLNTQFELLLMPFHGEHTTVRRVVATPEVSYGTEDGMLEELKKQLDSVCRVVDSGPGIMAVSSGVTQPTRVLFNKPEDVERFEKATG